MTKIVEDKLANIPLINSLVVLGKKIKIPGLQGLSLYDILEMYIIGIVRGALTSRAGGIAFSFFMALFPFLLFILTLIPFVPIEGFQADFIKALETLLPPNTGDVVKDVISDIANNRYGGLLSFGFIASIFLMTNGVNAVLGAFEYSYHIKEMRNVIKQYLVSMGMALMLSAILLSSIAINVYFAIGIHDLTEKGWLQNEGFWVKIGSAVFFLVLILVSVSFLYKYGTKKSKDFTYLPGAILTTLLTIVMFRLFAIYVVKFSTYNELYGSIGTLLVLMLFVWLNSIILLLGFELNASINRLKKLHTK
ncbi:membrane protein [Lutibacter agarilyticus]|uniref:Membrane protein n=1 Tax=Lutibacter agarilyticus TaxID=1109740 RepID=A0A238XLI0_9FLAO|nr:YihY/virulence factor BrkB family protein [Lutibacter agarilyticus]SNR59797.1 membrane protein [Lutibacter agarilyticus]